MLGDAGPERDDANCAPAGVPPGSRAALLGSLALVAGAAFAYLRTLLPTMGFGGDTAKFQFVGYVLGVPHVPGYPTYTVVNFLFTHLVPVGSIAYRANLLSAVFAVAAVAVLDRTLLRLGVRRLLSLAISLSFSLTFTFWSHAVVAEVYTLTVLFMALGLHFLVRWGQLRRDADLLAAMAIFGVALGHALSVYLLAPGLLAYAAVSDRRLLRRPGMILAAFGFVALGFSQYGYLVWRTLDPGTAFLETRITGLRSFVDVVTGAAFRPFMWHYSLRELWADRLPLLVRFLWREWSLLLPVAVYGLVRLGRAPLNVMLVAWALLVTIFGLEYAIPDVYVTFVPTYFVLAVWAGVGLEGIARRLPLRWVAALTAVALALPLAFAALNLPMVDQSKATRIAEATEEALAAMPDRSVVFSPDFAHYMFFGYYTLGEGLEGKRHIYAYPFESVKAPVAAYCRGETSLLLWPERKSLPPGLRAFAYGDAFARTLALEGLVTSPVIGELFAISCPETVQVPGKQTR
ncbi:MAG: protein O-mannosyl-transferase family [Nitriliruptorales bacterium]